MNNPHEFVDPLADDSPSKITTGGYAVIDFLSGIGEVLSGKWPLSLVHFFKGSLRIYLILPICKDNITKSLRYLTLAVAGITTPFLGRSNASPIDFHEVIDSTQTSVEDIDNASKALCDKETKESIE